MSCTSIQYPCSDLHSLANKTLSREQKLVPRRRRARLGSICDRRSDDQTIRRSDDQTIRRSDDQVPSRERHTARNARPGEQKFETHSSGRQSTYRRLVLTPPNHIFRECLSFTLYL